MATAYPRNIIVAEGSTRNFTLGFTEIDSDEMCSAPVTVAAPLGITPSNEAVNPNPISIEDKNQNVRDFAANQSVLFTLACNVGPGDYRVEVTCASTKGQVLRSYVLLTVC